MPIPKAYKNEKNAPWNDEPCPECPDCSNIIHDVESHAEDCPEPLPQVELNERLHERNAVSYDPVEHNR